MARSLDASTIAAVENTSAVAPVNFVLFAPTGGEHGFTDWGYDVTTNIVNGKTGATESKSFYGDEAPILEMDPIPLKIGIEINTVRIVLNMDHSAVETMVRGSDVRHVPVQVHRGFRDTATGAIVAAPRARFVGIVNGADISIGPVGGRAAVALDLVSETRELTRTTNIMWSDASQRLRSGDRICKYIEAYEAPWWWGQEAE